MERSTTALAAFDRRFGLTEYEVRDSGLRVAMPAAEQGAEAAVSTSFSESPYSAIIARATAEETFPALDEETNKPSQNLQSMV